MPKLTLRLYDSFKNDSLAYWHWRERFAELRTIQQEATYATRISDVYSRAQANIQKEIDSFYARYAKKEGISLADAKKRVSKVDIDAYGKKAKQYVATHDMSDLANEEMRLYNLTMKVNRLEMLKAEIGLHLLDADDELTRLVQEGLTDEATLEFARQAGLLGDFTIDTAKAAKAIVDASYHGAHFSYRIWNGDIALRNQLDTLLTNALVQGINPKKLAPKIEKAFGSTRYQAERLMRTEMCRVQTEVQRQSIALSGYTHFQFIAEHDSRTCEICEEKDGETHKIEDMDVGGNAPPVHPCCRCSISAYMDKAEYEAWLEDQVGKVFEY